LAKGALSSFCPANVQVVEFIDDEHADAAVVRVFVGWSTYLVVLDSTHDLQFAARLSDSS